MDGWMSIAMNVSCRWILIETRAVCDCCNTALRMLSR